MFIKLPHFINIKKAFRPLIIFNLLGVKEQYVVYSYTASIRCS
nr:MAG TPA: hypothetical protein [Caudoviricetes sp.]